MISKIRKNIMGTVSFDAKFSGMRKPQDFIVYPIKTATDHILIQSDTRIGYIMLDSGAVWMSKPHANGAYEYHLAERALIDRLDAEALFTLKTHIFATAHGDAGRAENRVIGTDNSGALEIFN